MTQQFFVFLSLVTLTFYLSPQIRTRARFLYSASKVIAKFHHPTFNRSEVIVRTNKQTDRQTLLKTSTLISYTTPVGNKQTDKEDSMR